MTWSILPPEPGIGDPSILGWATTLGYFAASLLALRASRATRRSQPSTGPLVRFWLTVAEVLVLLGVNKQLDFQLWLTYYGRGLALTYGWYERRALLQLAFVTLFGVAMVCGFVWLVWLVRAFLAQARLALLGLFLLLCFVVVRAISIDVVEVRAFIGGENVTSALEVLGVLTVAAAAAVNSLHPVSSSWELHRRRP